MQWYEGTSKKLEVGYRYSHQDLIRLLKSDYPQMSESSYHWAVCGMLKSEYPEVLKQAMETYHIEPSKMMRYARRRGREDEMKEILEEIENAEA